MGRRVGQQEKVVGLGIEGWNPTAGPGSVPLGKKSHGEALGPFCKPQVPNSSRHGLFSCPSLFC